MTGLPAPLSAHRIAMLSRLVELSICEIRGLSRDWLETVIANPVGATPRLVDLSRAILTVLDADVAEDAPRAEYERAIAK